MTLNGPANAKKDGVSRLFQELNGKFILSQICPFTAALDSKFYAIVLHQTKSSNYHFTTWQEYQEKYPLRSLQP